jgi:hypothetical protein
MTDVCKHLPADSATVAAFWRVGFALANVLAFRKTPCGGIGGRQRFATFDRDNARTDTAQLRELRPCRFPVWCSSTSGAKTPNWPSGYAPSGRP